MAKYTIELRKLDQSGFDYGLYSYPIFDETYRTALNTKIRNHFKFREIGFETPALFAHYLNMTMNEQMPLYNQLYRSALLTFDPLSNYRMAETATRSTDGKTSTQTAGESHAAGTTHDTQTEDALTVESTTPAGLLSIGDIKTNTFASKAQRQDNTTNADGTTTGTNEGTSASETAVENLDEYVRTVSGATGNKSPGELIMEFRKTFLNIDMLVIDALETCFMGVW